MSGSTVLNQRQHVGLQQLTLLGSVANTSLGPNKNLKFIQDETSGTSYMTGSCFRLLENLELSCGAEQLVAETVQAHHKVYHSGSGCVLFITGAWSRAALECLQRGLAASDIITAMSEGLNICLDICMKNCISIRSLDAVASGNVTVESPGLGVSLPVEPIIGPVSAASHLHRGKGVDNKLCNNSGQQKIRLTHSRHFCETKSGDVHTVLSSHSPHPKHNHIAQIAEAVSHGCIDAMNLVVQASQLQSKSCVQDGGHDRFEISRVVTCVIPGLSEDSSCVLPGCVVVLSTEQASIAQHLKGKHLQVALINGDLCHSYRHLGFNKPTCIGHVTNTSALGDGSKEEVWLENVLKTLLNLNVNLILTSGVANEKLIQHCIRHHLLVVEKIKPSTLKAFADAAGAISVTYATQLNRQCVGTGLHIQIWRDLCYGGRKSSMVVNIVSDHNVGLVSVVLCSFVPSKLQVLEDQFWSAANRLHHALKDGALLPGAGVIEMLCIHGLQTHMGAHGGRSEEKAGCSVEQSRSLYRDVVLGVMAEGLMDYVATVIGNSRRCSKVEAWAALSRQLTDWRGGFCRNGTFSNLPSREKMEDSITSDMQCSSEASKNVYDNLSVKLEAWQKALDVVLLVLQTDAEIITGVDLKAVDAKSHVELL